MSQYFKAKVKQNFSATINNIKIIYEDKYIAIKDFLTDFSEIVDDIKSDNEKIRFEKISKNFVQTFINILDDIYKDVSDGVDSFFVYEDISQHIVVNRRGAEDDLSDIYVTYMGEENTYFKDFNERLKEKDF